MDIVLNHCTTRRRGEPTCSPLHRVCIVIIRISIRADTQVCPYGIDDLRWWIFGLYFGLLIILYFCSLARRQGYVLTILATFSKATTLLVPLAFGSLFFLLVKALASVFDISAGVFDAHTGKFDPGAGRVDAHTGKLDPGAGRVDAHTGKFDHGAGRVDAHPGVYDHGAGKVDAHPGVYDHGAGRVDAHAGKFDHGAGRVDAHAGKFDHGAGRVDASAGVFDPGAGRVDAHAGKLDHGAGMLRFIPC